MGGGGGGVAGCAGCSSCFVPVCVVSAVSPDTCLIVSLSLSLSLSLCVSVSVSLSLSLVGDVARPLSLSPRWAHFSPFSSSVLLCSDRDLKD